MNAFPASIILLSITINMLFLPSYTCAPESPASSRAKSFIAMYDAVLAYGEDNGRTYRLSGKDKPKLPCTLPGFSFAGIPEAANKDIPYLDYCLISAGDVCRSFSLTRIVDSLHLKDGMK